MKKSISGVWLIGLVTLFTFVFAGYLAITINYSSAFKVKNQMLTIIEKQKGVYDKKSFTTASSTVKGGSVYKDVGSLQIISLYLYGYGYKTQGTCDIGSGVNKTLEWYGITDLGVNNGDVYVTPKYEKVKNGSTKYYYCVAKGTYANGSSYYKLQTFYKLDLPVVGDAFTFRIEGTTAEIYEVTNNMRPTAVKGPIRVMG